MKSDYRNQQNSSEIVLHRATEDLLIDVLQLPKNCKLLFGYKSKKRRTRIMVTLPNSAADDQAFVQKLISLGMNCARINCAHDDPDIWARMIENIHKANEKLKTKCKIAMDLAGPKLRSGQMIPVEMIDLILSSQNELGQRLSLVIVAGAFEV